VPESDEKCGCEERMSRRERIIDRMWDEWSYTTDDILRSHTPLWYPEIDHRVYDEREYHDEKYLESPYSISIVLSRNSSEPEKEEKSCHKKYDRLSCYLYHECRVWTEESSCPYEC
jgi:hypothetical protein